MKKKMLWKHFLISLIIFISLIVTLYLFSFYNSKLPNTIGINGYIFVGCFFIFYLIFLLCTYILYKRKAIYHIASYSFLGYLFLLMLLLFFLSNVINEKDLYFTINKYNFNKKWFFKAEYNLVPFYILEFKKDSNTFLGYIFNYICFIPFGFLLPYIFDTFNKKYTVLRMIIIFLISTILIETLQFILPIDRRVDIDDAISNLFGSLTGYFIYSIIKRKINIYKE